MCFEDYMRFPDLRLHDSVVQSIEYLWEQKSVRITGLLCSKESVQFEIGFSEVSVVNITQSEPWGPSVSVNEVRVSEKGAYIIVMQSGDDIQVFASSFAYKEVHT